MGRRSCSTDPAERRLAREVQAAICRRLQDSRSVTIWIDGDHVHTTSIREAPMDKVVGTFTEKQSSVDLVEMIREIRR